MEIRKKIIIVGTSLGVVIDKPYIELLKLKVGDLIELNIKKVRKWNNRQKKHLLLWVLLH